MGSSSGAYSWLRGKGYISGTGSALAQNGQSCLSWLGGNMPPSGPGSWSQSATDLKAWAQAGAPNN
jgi:hypothetical protein